VAQFEPAVELVLKHEGGLVSNPSDPGGLTNFGISQRSFPDLDIASLTVEQAKEIYAEKYWSFDDIEDQATANCLLDCAVNQGVVVANELRGMSLKDIQLARLMRYSRLDKPQFLHSWFARTLDV
jgi:lysozyme family protein